MKPLTETPDEVRLITDDADVKLLMIQLDMLDATLAQETAHRAKYPVRSGTRALARNHPTHWIAVDSFWGFANPTDNGYAALCYPKSKYTKLEFIENEVDRAFGDFDTSVRPIQVTGVNIKTRRN